MKLPAMLKKLLKNLKSCCRSIFSVTELLLCKYLVSRKVRGYDDKILVIQDCHVGDFLVSLPFFQRMKKFYGRKLTLISDKRIVPLAMECGCFDEVIAFDMKRASSYKHIFYRWQTLRSLRKVSGQVLIQKYSVGGTVLEDCMALIIQSPEKIGVDSDKTDSNGGGKFYGDLLRKNFGRMYKYDNAINLLANENGLCNMICSGNETDCVGNLECFEPLPDKEQDLGTYALFIVGADDPRRRWEPEKFAFVAEKFLLAKPEYKIIFTGSPSEREVINKVVSGIPRELKNRVIVRESCQDYLQSIKRLFADVKYATIMLSGDTGPLHIAAKYNVKCVCISGVWHYNVWTPWQEYKNTVYLHGQCDHTGCFGACRYDAVPFKCLSQLSAERVWTELEKHC